MKKRARSYEGSNDNMLRSLNILYDGGLMSKRKYKLTRSNLSFEANKNKSRTKLKYDSGLTIPVLVEYGKLMEFVKSIDYGELQRKLL